MMKKLILLLLALCLPLTAVAEVYRIEGPEQLPEGWAEQDILRMSVLDMQRSDAILLECGGENMLVDGGLGLHYKRLFQMLDDRGITGFKYLWNTHCDGDHSQGLKCIMNSDLYGTGQLLCPNKITYDDPDDDHEKMVTAAKRHGWEYVQITNGDVFTLGGATITCIRIEENWGQNNRSAACFVDFGESTVFLTGDIGSRVQKHFAATVDAERMDCDILKAPHHGIDSVTPVFLEAVSPEAVVITNYTNNGAHASWDKYDPYFAGDGVVVFETNGTDWYIWQTDNVYDP